MTRQISTKIYCSAHPDVHLVLLSVDAGQLSCSQRMKSSYIRPRLRCPAPCKLDSRNAFHGSNVGKRNLGVDIRIKRGILIHTFVRALRLLRLLLLPHFGGFESLGVGVSLNRWSMQCQSLETSYTAAAIKNDHVSKELCT